MPIEEQLLPHKDLARFYQQVSWLYVCRTFDKKPAKDRLALRAHDRFGISSWPQMLVFDPRDDRVLATPPRDLPGFVRTFERVLAKWRPLTAEQRAQATAISRQLAEARQLLVASRQPPTVADRDRAQRALDILDRLIAARDPFGGWLEAIEIHDAHFEPDRTAAPLDSPDPHVRLVRLEELARGLPDQPVSAAERDRAAALLHDPAQDIVVRIRALRLLRVLEPARIKAAVATFLRIPNDQWRYEVLGWIKDHPQPAHSTAVLDLMDGIGSRYPSHNPNVVRIRALESLARCGDQAAVPPLLALLAGPLNNVLTRLTPRALAQIGRREPAAVPRITAALLDALPPAVTAPPSKTSTLQQRLSTALAREIAGAVAELTGRPAPPVGRGWTAPDRLALRAALDQLVKNRR